MTTSAPRRIATPPVSLRAAVTDARRVLAQRDARILAELSSVFPLLALETTPGAGATTLLRTWSLQADSAELRLLIEADKVFASGEQLLEAAGRILAREAGRTDTSNLAALLTALRHPLVVVVTRCDFLPVEVFVELLRLLKVRDSVQIVISGFDLHEFLDEARSRRVPFRRVTDEDLALHEEEVAAHLTVAGIEPDPVVVAGVLRRTRGLASAVRASIDVLSDRLDTVNPAEAAMMNPGEIGGNLFADGLQEWPSPLVEFVSTMMHVPRFTFGEAAAIGQTSGARVLIDRMCALDLGRVTFHPALRQRVFTWFEQARIGVLQYLTRSESADEACARLQRTLHASLESFDAALYLATLVELGRLAEAERYLEDWFWDCLPNGYSPVWANVAAIGSLEFADFPRLALLRLRVEAHRRTPQALYRSLFEQIARAGEARPGANTWQRLGHLAITAELARAARRIEPFSDVVLRTRELLDAVIGGPLAGTATPGAVASLLTIADVAFRLGDLPVAAEQGRWALALIDSGTARLDPWGERRMFAARIILASDRERGIRDSVDAETTLAAPQFRWRDSDIVAQLTATVWSAIDGGELASAEQRCVAAQRHLDRPGEWPALWYLRLWLAGLMHEPDRLPGLRASYEASVAAVGMSGAADRTPDALRRIAHVIGGYLAAPDGVIAAAQIQDPESFPRWQFDALLLDALEALRTEQFTAARTLLTQAIDIVVSRPLSTTSLVVALPEEIRRLGELVADHPRAASLHLEQAMVLAGQVDNGVELSDREREVLTLLRRGMTNQQIADELYVSVNTAKYHRGNLMRKLGASTRQQLLEMAAQLGL